ncbi:bifunctional adenosylcobinamide kinase/adenosylcobinamide-phosphate guanylyltransferase [Pantanalinema rosaneae CENA516]|uniref:bifunctional adenosylcobinamide kinase/adenosylcobinamide-phosphate guanylyltransferase n=1 Tax=Pantanalinema rosaneae TaxID=1620701 RepID=UPI003D6DFD5A
MTTQQRLILVTGPARSGKSEWAEQLAAVSGRSVIYVATAQVDPADPEWLARIQQHQQRRPANWVTQSVPITLSAMIPMAAPTDCLLIDSLGTWVANLLECDELIWEQTVTELVQVLDQSLSSIILVAEETGWGVVPAYPSGRLFRDRLGNLTRRIGAIADGVYLVTAGYALNLKQLGIPIRT